MNEWLKKLSAQIKNLWSKWTAVQKGILIGIVVVVIAAIILVCSVSSKPTRVAVFSAPIKDEAQLTKILTHCDQNNFRITEDNGYIYAENDLKAKTIRMSLITENLVPTTLAPWAIFDQQDWTTTDFERDQHLRKNVTDLITETLETLDIVESAKVDINLANSNALFASEAESTATVAVKLNTDHPSKKQIQGMVRAVACGIPLLKEENITLIDARTSVQLNDFDTLNDYDSVNLLKMENQTISKLEKEYEERIYKTLAGIYSEDRVQRPNIRIEMNMSARKTDATEYTPIHRKEDDPDTPYDDSDMVDSITLSSQTVTKKYQGTAITPNGPAGTAGQTVPVYQDMGSMYGLQEETGVITNEAVNKKQIHEETRPTITRVTVGVAIDGTWKVERDDKGKIVFEKGEIKRTYTPLSAEEIANIESIVKDAIGSNKNRKDSVSIKNTPFDRSAQFARENAQYLKDEQNKNIFIGVLIAIALLLLLFVVYKFVSRAIERRKRLKEEELLRKHQMEREKTLWEAENASSEVTMSVEERKRLELQENAITMAKEHPEDVAMLIRTWLMEE